MDKNGDWREMSEGVVGVGKGGEETKNKKRATLVANSSKEVFPFSFIVYQIHEKKTNYDLITYSNQNKS